MTNYEAMRLMDKDELVEFLLSIMMNKDELTEFLSSIMIDKDELTEFLSSIMDGEAMRTMDKDELTEFLSSIVDCGAIRIMDKDALAKFLSSIAYCKKCPASEKFCDGQRDCVDAMLNWLNAESDDLTELKRRLKDDPHHDVLATASLAKLAAENPTLPIVAMVNFEVVPGDESAYWTGEIDNVDVRELWLSQYDDARTWDREDAEFDYEEFIERYASNEDLMKIESLTDEKLYKQAAMEWIAGLPWTKCIVIFVEAPDKLTRRSTK